MKAMERAQSIMYYLENIVRGVMGLNDKDALTLTATLERSVAMLHRGVNALVNDGDVNAWCEDARALIAELEGDKMTITCLGVKDEYQRQ